MALDQDTITQLASLQSELQSQQQSLQSKLAYVQNIKDAVANAGLDVDELLAVDQIVFADVPEQGDVEKEAAKVSAALSALAKILPPPPPAPVV